LAATRPSRCHRNDPGYFNYADYEHNTLREVRFGLTASMRASSRLAILGELRSENFDHVSPFALYARVRPFPTRRFDIQAGRIPPTFGAFTRRAYGNDNPLIGYPLAYQYLTSLRADSVPSSADDLLRMRGRGWQTNFGVGQSRARARAPAGHRLQLGHWRAGEHGLARRCRGGRSHERQRVESARVGRQRREADRAARRDHTGNGTGDRIVVLPRRVPRPPRAQCADEPATAGSLSSEPTASMPSIPVTIGWCVPTACSASGSFRNSLRHPTRGMLKALAGSVEARYTFMPGAYAAARVERLTFSRIAGSTRTATWDAPVSRYEIGGGYYIQRNVVARLSYQHNARDGGRVTRDGLMAAQLLFWF
jgi:hypothetical protein